MDTRDNSYRFDSLPNTTLRNLSSSSSAFFSANQSPFFSPTFHLPTNSDNPCHPTSINMDPLELNPRTLDSESFPNIKFSSAVTSNNPRRLDPISSLSNSPLLNYEIAPQNDYFKQKGRARSRLPENEYSSRRNRSCDVYIGFHGRKPLLLRFTNWLRAELEGQGLSCFVTDRARCRNSRKHSTVEKAMDSSTFGVIILTRKSFRNPYTIEELRFFSSKKNLVPVYFDLGPDDCLVRDIIEKRGELWEKHGGELWVIYGGLEREWRDSVNALSRSDEWKLEARDGKWRDCILRAVTLLALRLGRRSVVDRITKWREKADREEFPFPRNSNFIGRKKELSELEFMLFGDVSGDAERDYIKLKARPFRKNVTIDWGRTNSMDEKRRIKGKEPVVWKESEKEIEMENSDFALPKIQTPPKVKSGARRGRKPTKVLYGKGIACVSGDSGIGKTELLLEFAYRFHQRYKMVLWMGGENRYIRQNYLNLWSFLEIDVGVESGTEKTRTKSFEEQEEEAIARVRKELSRNVPFLVIIDNLESEKDWWDHKLVMDLLPRFGGETHVIISTRLPSVMNLEPLKLSYLSGLEAMTLMQGGNNRDQSITEIDALRTIEEKLGRLTLGLAIVGAILTELPINPSRLLDTINRMPLRGVNVNLQRNDNNFLSQLFEVCFSIFDHADGPRSLATRMVLASGWFAPAQIPVPVLASAGQKIPEKHKNRFVLQNLFRSLTCGLTSSYARKSEAEACSLLLRFNMARGSTKEGFIQFNHLVKLYSRKRGIAGAARAMVRAVLSRGLAHSDHVWAACFLLLGFGKDPIVVELKVPELLTLVKDLILPLAVKTFITFSRCTAAIQLLRLCTNALEAADQEFATPVENWSLCWRPVGPTSAELNPLVWQELALARATVLEVRAKLMVRGGQFDIGDDLIRKAIFIRSSICGENHPETVAAKETLVKITRLIGSVGNRASP